MRDFQNHQGQRIALRRNIAGCLQHRHILGRERFECDALQLVPPLQDAGNNSTFGNAVEHDLDFAKRFAEAIRTEHPEKMLAYNCSPSFNWKKNLDDSTIAKFQRELGAMGYKYQFITLAGWHALNYHAFDLADRYREQGMSAYVDLQEREFESADRGYTAAKHQREVGAGYFDAITTAVSGGVSELTALSGSTQEEQFEEEQGEPAQATAAI